MVKSGGQNLPHSQSVCLIFSTKKQSSFYNNLPNSLLINGLVLKGSKSSICSPVPIKIIGLLVAATLEIKPHIKPSV